MPRQRSHQSQVDEIKAKAIVTATLDNNVASILAFLKQYGPGLITSGRRDDLELIQSAIVILRLIETDRAPLEESLVDGYLFANRLITKL